MHHKSITLDYFYYYYLTSYCFETIWKYSILFKIMFPKHDFKCFLNFGQVNWNFFKKQNNSKKKTTPPNRSICDAVRFN